MLIKLLKMPVGKKKTYAFVCFAEVIIQPQPNYRSCFHVWKRRFRFHVLSVIFFENVTVLKVL